MEQLLAALRVYNLYINIARYLAVAEQCFAQLGRLICSNWHSSCSGLQACVHHGRNTVSDPYTERGSLTECQEVMLARVLLAPEALRTKVHQPDNKESFSTQTHHFGRTSHHYNPLPHRTPDMPATTAETLAFVSRNVSVAPLVLLSAADHYGRSAKGTRKRVVGVVLGQNDGKNVRVSNSFAGS